MRPNLQETADLVSFTEKILDGKIHFLCSASFEYEQRWKVILSIIAGVGVFKIWLIVISFWDFVAYNLKEFQNETPVTFVIRILRLSTRKQISLSGCTFSQKDFTQEVFTSKRLYFNKTLVNLSLGIKLNLHKPHHTTCKIVFYCGVLRNGF